ncbi:MAG TPA: hypothetical protein VND93_01550 [Myxococcales bacterium]|nr:hypothetical protein [Myxococcales bacterium]
MARKRIGELLLEREAVTQEQLEQGLSHHKKTRQRLGVALIQLGFLTESALAQVLSDALHIPAIDLESIQPEWAAIHMLRSRFCESHDLFPYALEGSGKGSSRKMLLVAMSDPLNVPALEEIEFSTGLKVSPRIATLSAIRRSIMRWYHKSNPDTAHLDAQTMTVIQKGNVTFQVPNEEEVVQGEPLGEDVQPTDRSALVQLINERQTQSKARRAEPAPAAARAPGGKPKSAQDTLSQDLDFLFGARDESNPVEALERKFWALMRLMAKKGLITKDEFSAELDEELE